MKAGARAAQGRRSPRRTPSRPAAVRFALRDGVAWLTLDRPAAGNRLDPEVQGALADACAAAEEAREARVVVLAARLPAGSNSTISPSTARLSPRMCMRPRSLPPCSNTPAVGGSTS